MSVYDLANQFDNLISYFCKSERKVKCIVCKTSVVDKEKHNDTKKQLNNKASCQKPQKKLLFVIFIKFV